MANIVRFKKSSVPGKIPSPSDLSLGEIAINTFDGKLFTKKQQGAIQKVIEIGAMESENTLYVSKSGNDANSGKTLSEAKLTIKAACEIATPGTAIIVKSGEYIEDNPVYLPAKVAIVGDSLRTVTIRPKNTNQDIFWVNNASYIIQATFKGHVAPAAAVAFPPDGSAGFIVQSPYVQNATSLTTTGTGMKVDGAVTTGLRSMVLDAFTQYNQGGIGIHMLNQGNTQLVSCFTICCDISFLCEDGGFCSITNSNTSFGRLGLVSRGASPALYFGTVKGDTNTGRVVFNNLAKRPNVGDGVLFADYNQETCERDTGLIVDSLAFDLLFDSFTQSTFSGLRYWAKDSTTIPGEVTETIAAINHAKTIAQSVVRNVSVTPQSGNAISQVTDLGNPGTVYGARLIEQDFSLIANIIQNGPKSNAIITEPDISLGEPEYRVLRKQVLNQKTTIIKDMIDYLNTTYPSLEYDQSVCRRDAGLIIDAVIDDLVFGSNYRSVTAAQLYFTSNVGYFIPSDQFDETVDAISYIKNRVSAVVNEDPTAQTIVEDRFDTIIDILNNTPSVSPTLTYPPTQDLDQDIINAVSILRANRDFLAAEVIAYINFNYPSLIYTSSTCSRDVKYVIDAICYDLTYGGNSQTLRAAERYYSYLSGAAQLDPDELEATLDAYASLQLNVERTLINDLITPLQGLITQNISLDPATINEISAARSLFTILLDVIEEGITGDSDYIIPNGLETTQTGIINTFNLLQSNKNFIIADTVAYVNNTYPSFTYDQSTCERDLGYIIDSVSFDLKYGGNRQTVQAGVYYYDFSSETNFIQGQVTQTIAALEYLKELIENIITTKPTSTTWQTNVEQDITLTSGSENEVLAVNDRISLIQDILRNGPVGEDSTTRVKEAIGLTPVSNTDVVNAFNLILANRLFIQKEMTAYINNNWFELSNGEYPYFRVADVGPLTLGTTETTLPTIENESSSLLAARTTILNAKETIKTNTIAFLNANFFDNFVFDQSKCYRDVGLILDAVTEDIVFGTNYKTIIAATSYLRAYTSEVINNQKEQTIEAIEAARDFTLGLVVNLTAKQEIESNYNTLLSILDQGINAVPNIVFPNPNNTDTGITNAAAVLQANKDFIVAEIVAYINENLNALFYDNDKCSRDVGLIIDALAYDYVLETNFQTVTAGLAYLRANASDVLVEPQKIATIDAMLYLKQELISLVENNSAATTSISNGIDIIISIIENGSNSAPALTYPSNITTSQDQIDARTQLIQNKDFIVADITAWIQNNYPSLTYDSAKCERDVGFIIDGLCYDITYGGTWASNISASSYYVGAVSQLGAGESAPTSAAYTHMQQILELIVKGESVTPQSGNSEIQITSGGVATSAEAAEIASLMQIIIDVIDDGDLDDLPAIQYPSIVWASTIAKNSHQTLLTSRSDIQSSVIDYINNKPRLIYDETLCSRDVGLIVDALSYDLYFGSNFRSIKAGQSYYRSYASEVINEPQKRYTLLALEFIKDKAITAVTGNTTAVASVTNNMDIIIDIFDNGLSSIPSFTLPNPTGYSSGFQNARDLIVANTEFINEELEEYMTINYPDVSYDRVACRRDVEYIIDALRYDLTYGGNSQSIAAGNAYFSGTILQLGLGERIPTLNTYIFLKSLLIDIAQNISVTPLQPDVLQISGTAGSITAANFAADRIDEIITIINATQTAPVLNLPSISWVDPLLIDKGDALLASKSTIQSDTIDYVNSLKYFAYDQTACERDTAYIVDALTYDLLYGGNTSIIEAGRSYFTGTGSNVVEGELNETILAYQYMSTIVQKIVRNISITPTTGNSETQNTGLSAGSLRASDTLRDLFSVLIPIVRGGISEEAPKPILPTFSNGNATKNNVRRNLAALRKYVQDKTLDYIISEVIRNFNQEKCARDVGLILDAVTYDMVLNSNYQSIRAGSAYQQVSAKLVQEKQLGPTLRAIEFVKDATLDLVSSNATAVSRLTDRFDIIYDIIKDGEAYAPAISNPIPTGGSVDAVNAAASIQANIEFVKEETLAYVSQNYRSYDTAKCSRDLDLIINGILYDMIFGGNYQSKKAGLSYRRVSAAYVLSDQLESTMGGISYARDKIIDLLEGDSLAIQRINQGFATVLDIIENGEGVAPVVNIPNGSYDTENDNGKNIILANLQFIKDEIIAYVNFNYVPGLTYDPATCARDVGLIAEAVAYDLTYEGNSQSVDAGLQYYLKGGLVIPTNQKAETLDAIDHLNDILRDLVINTAITPTSGNITAQNTSLPSADAGTQSRIDDLVNYIYDILDNGTTSAPTIVNPTVTGADSTLQDLRLTVIGSLSSIKSDTITYINETYLGFGYNFDTCKRDIEYILDSVCYDLIYGGNSQTKYAAEQYFAGGTLQITENEKNATVAAYAYIDLLVRKIILNTSITPLQTFVSQDTTNPAATITEVNKIKALFDAATDIIMNGYTCVVTLDASFRRFIANNTRASFHQQSQITSSGHTFEWVGAGNDIESALPYNGGVPIEENEIVKERGGEIYFTSTDQKGDFKIGAELTIQRDSGSIIGRAFNKSLLAVMTPYILALEGG
jgi:hypothetical protein